MQHAVPHASPTEAQLADCPSQVGESELSVLCSLFSASSAPPRQAHTSRYQGVEAGQSPTSQTDDPSPYQ